VVLHKLDSVDIIIPLITELEMSIDPDLIKGPKELKETYQEFQKNLALFRSLISDASSTIGTNEPGPPSLADELREQEIKRLSANLIHLLAKAEQIKEHEISRRSEYLSSLIRHIENVTVILLGVAVLVALITPWLLARTIKRPIERLQEGTKAIGKGKFDHKIPVDRRDEFGELAHSFNEMAQRLKELDRLKSDFIAVASHELKTPLAAMIEASKLLSEPAIGELNPKQEKLVTVLNKSMERFKDLIEELLDLSRLQAGLVQLDKQKCRLSELVQEAVEAIQPTAQAARNEIIIEILDDDTQISIDKKRFLRALINLIDNAVKFNPISGKVKISARVEGKKKDDGKGLLFIAVSDMGPGIDTEERDKVFEKFYQIQHIRKQSGSGLGLAIAREIITAHGGKIWIESPPPEDLAVEKGQGTVFFVELPC
jgi:signal transduction histidine kinase